MLLTQIFQNLKKVVVLAETHQPAFPIKIKPGALILLHSIFDLLKEEFLKLDTELIDGIEFQLNIFLVST